MTTANIASVAVDHPAVREAPAELAGPDRRAQDAALFARYREHADPRAREALVLRFLPLARHLARHYRSTGEREDLEQVASLALLRAIDRFDPERGIAFSSFAVPTITGELKRYFRDKGWAVRVPRSVQELKLRVDREQPRLLASLGRSPTAAELAEATSATLEDVLDALNAATAHRPDSLDRPLGDGGTSAVELVGGELEPGYARTEAAMYVDALTQSLSDRERAILRMRFEDDLTQAEIGQRLGISQMHVSRLIRQAIATLQATNVRPLRADGGRRLAY